MEKLSATVENAGETSVVTLVGFLDEDNQLKTLVEKIPGDAIAMIDLAGVARINSCGIRDWVNWLAALDAKGTRPVLVGCSPAIVAQINLVQNFAGNGAVKSFQVPYHCRECDEEKIVVVETSDMTEPSSASAPTCSCPHCGRDMDLDEMADSYFAFLGQPAARNPIARGSSALVGKPKSKAKSKPKSRISEPPARRSQPVLSAYQTPVPGTQRISSSTLIVVKRPSRPSHGRMALGSNDRLSGNGMDAPIRPSAMPAPRSDVWLWVAIVLVLMLGIAALAYFVLVQ